MTRRIEHSALLGFFTGVALSAGLMACSTNVLNPQPPLPEEAPGYVKVPHPNGYDLGDVKAIFIDAQAPQLANLKTCDSDYRRLRELTENPDEVRDGTLELVRTDPTHYHWCFYGKVLELEKRIKEEPYIDLRQKHVVETYYFLVPIARAFMTEFRDTRYMRWALQRYRKLSEWFFFRKMELTPQTTTELTELTNPFGLWRPTEGETKPIMEKYGLGRAPAAVASPGPSASPGPEASPAASASPQPGASPMALASPGPESSPVAATPPTAPVPGASPQALASPEPTAQITPDELPTVDETAATAPAVENPAPVPAGETQSLQRAPASQEPAAHPSAIPAATPASPPHAQGPASEPQPASSPVAMADGPRP